MQPELLPLPQNDFLNTARKERKRVVVYLVNGVRLFGRIESFDQFTVMLSTPEGNQAIYKSAISTVQPESGGRSSRSGEGAAKGETSDTDSALPHVVRRKRRSMTAGR
jgi:host factor-I protein